MNEYLYSSKILSKGQIKDVSKGFKLQSGEIFSIFLVPKGITVNTSTCVNCKLIGESKFGNFPVVINDWTSGAIKEIAPNGVDLATFDVYWGSGSSVSPK